METLDPKDYFRAWPTDEKYIEIIGVHYFDLGDFFEPDCWIIERYIGQKDKNNKKIYEGDIIPMGNSGNMVVMLGRFTMYEMYDIGETEIYGAFLKSGKNTTPIDFDFIGYYEVIGNIHENPELLTKLEA